MVELIMLTVPYVVALVAIIAAFILGRATAQDRYEQGFADGVEATEFEAACLEETPADMREKARRAFMGEPIKLNY